MNYFEDFPFVLETEASGKDLCVDKFSLFTLRMCLFACIELLMVSFSMETVVS